jgi:hypothetical protein
VRTEEGGGTWEEGVVRDSKEGLVWREEGRRRREEG